MNIEGNIEAVRKDRAGFMMEGEVWYSMPRGQKIPYGIDKGTTVSFAFKQNGTWNNIEGPVTAVGVDANADAPPNAAAGAPATGGSTGKYFPVPSDTKDHIIMRQNSLTAAAMLFHGKGPDVDAQAVLEIAEQFVAWTTGRSGE